MAGATAVSQFHARWARSLRKLKPEMLAIVYS